MAKQSRKRKTTDTVQVNTTGGAVRITHPASSRGKTTAKEKAAVVVDVVTPRAVDGFIDFLRERAVVGLAIGVVIGTQLKVITDTLNAGFINPLFGLVFNGGALNTQTSTLNWHGRTADLAWGSVVYQIINFLFILAVFYAIIKFFRLDKLDKKDDDKK
ncbi:MAG TPA: MscL family protein [Candidatus Saccharimonadales bacterium]